MLVCSLQKHIVLIELLFSRCCVLFKVVGKNYAFVGTRDLESFIERKEVDFNIDGKKKIDFWSA
jgi:hypothetical protein